MTDINHGTVEVTLGGETFVLEPTLNALQRIDRSFGSIRAAVQRCSELSLEAIVSVIAAGADVDAKEAKRLPELVYREGLVNVAPQLTEYLVALMNPGGRKGAGEGKR
jgi:hypothetical protein